MRFMSLALLASLSIFSIRPAFAAVHHVAVERCYGEATCQGASVRVRNRFECTALLRRANATVGSFSRGRTCQNVTLQAPAPAAPSSLFSPFSDWDQNAVTDPYGNGQPQFSPDYHCSDLDIRTGMCI